MLCRFVIPSLDVVGIHMDTPQNIGSLAGYPFAPYLSDGLGRRPTIWIGATIMLIAVALQSAAQNWGMFLGSR